MIRQLLILGASGDLTARYLVPALAALQQSGELPADCSIIGMARTDWDSPHFRSEMSAALLEHAPDVDATARATTVEAMTYLMGDVTDASDLRAALEQTDGPVAVYLALPPTVLAATLRALIAVGLPEGSRIAIEKPFGHDLRSAQELNELLHGAFPEPAIFRIDHFLAEQAVRSLFGLRFANRLLEPTWRREHIERVEIVWEETLALEGRAGYYDSTGQLRDMIQSHLLQVLCFVAMESPASLDEFDVRDRKVELLHAVRRLTPEEVDAKTVRARYTAGLIAGSAVPSYVDEVGVDPARETETFAQVELSIDNERWAGVPFVLRTGKAMEHERFEISVYFRPLALLGYAAGAAPAGNLLRLYFEPASITLSLAVNAVGDLYAMEPVDLMAELTPPDLPPYARILRGILQGQMELAVRDDEAEASWSIVEPIVDAWARGHSPLREYAAGTQMDDTQSDGLG